MNTITPVPVTIHKGLAIYRVGNGPPIFLMPGPHRFQHPGHPTADALIQGLLGLGRQVITFDPPESGYSTRPAHLSMTEMLDCTCEALEVCGITGQVDALGHSMGGFTLLAFALERPALIKSLVLVGTGSGSASFVKAAGSLANRSHPDFWKMATLGIFHMVWPRLAPQKMMRNFIARESFVDQRYVQPETIDPGDWFRPRTGRTDWQWVARKLDYTPRLQEITTPTLILCGRHDPQFPIASSEVLVAGIPNAQIIYFEHSGHFPFIEESAEFWSAVERFWTR